jgi:ribosomal protein S18 acetylase RimI-like enzyme
MVCQVDEVAYDATIPAGISLRRLEVDQDAPALYALDAASFAANPDDEPESFAAFCDEHLHAHDLDPELSCVAQHGDTIAGFLLARRRQDDGVGYIDLLAVHPDQQRRGLATLLLRTAFSRFAAAGLREGQLGVASDNPRALGLYERAGMKPRFQADTYVRRIVAS